MIDNEGRGAAYQQTHPKSISTSIAKIVTDVSITDEWILEYLKTNHPELSYSGMYIGNPFEKENRICEIRLSMKWIQENVTPTKSIRHRRSSYVYKHIVERECREYISNGSFIAAAFILGYKYALSCNGVNCFFNMHLLKKIVVA